MFSRFLCSVALCLALSACGGGGSGSSNQPAPPPLNNAPLPSADNARTRPGVAVDVPVLANDTDPDGDILSIESAVANNGASVQVVGNLLRVTPATDFAGAVEVSYRARDARGAVGPPATLSVYVGPTARVLTLVYSMPAGSVPGLPPPLGGGGVAAAPPTRVVIASTQPQDYIDLLHLGPCQNHTWGAISADGRVLVGVDCASSTRMNLITAAPRARQLAPPQVLMSNVSLARGLVIDGDFAGVIVAQRLTNLDLPFGGNGEFELVRLDLAPRAVVQRMPLPIIEEVFSIRAAGGGSRKVLILGRAYGSEEAAFIADLNTGELRWLGPAGVSAPVLTDMYLPSPDGRFIISPYLSQGEVTGYDLQNPGFMTTFWAPPAPRPFPGGLPTRMQFAQTPGADLIVRTPDSTTQSTQVVWNVPLDAPGNARELARFEATSATPMLVRGDQLAYVSTTLGMSEIRRVSVSSGAALSTLTPAGGLPEALELERMSANILLFSRSTGLALQGSLVRLANPGVIEPVAPALSLIYPGSMSMDSAETALGLSVFDNGTNAAYVVDMNLLSAPVKVIGGAAATDSTQVMLVFGSPDP